MKDNELDLDMLENADDETVKRLAEEYRAAPESDLVRLFERSEKRFASRKTDDDTEAEMTVSGVERYRRPVWTRILTAASVVVLAAGAVTGGALLVRDFSDRPDDTLSSAADPETAACRAVAPFGDISGSRVRCLSAAYAPYIYDAPAETAGELAEAFNLSSWDELNGEEEFFDGETVTIFVDGAESRFQLTFCGDNTVEYKTDGITTRYSVSQEASAAAYKAAAPAELNGHLIWSKFEDLTFDGVWKNNEPVPEDIFETPALPAELEGKYIIDTEPLYEYAFDMENIENDAQHADDFIIGKVTGIRFTSRGGTAYTEIDVDVSEALKGETAGESITVVIAGGYVSMREVISQPGVAAHASPDNSELKDYDVDNTYYHHIVGSAQVPIIGKEYAFFVSEIIDGRGWVTGEEYGILYKCDNLFIQRTTQGFNFYDIDDIKSMMDLE